MRGENHHLPQSTRDLKVFAFWNEVLLNAIVANALKTVAWVHTNACKLNGRAVDVGCEEFDGAPPVPALGRAASGGGGREGPGQRRGQPCVGEGGVLGIGHRDPEPAQLVTDVGGAELEPQTQDHRTVQPPNRMRI